MKINLEYLQEIEFKVRPKKQNHYNLLVTEIINLDNKTLYPTYIYSVPSNYIKFAFNKSKKSWMIHSFDKEPFLALEQNLSKSAANDVMTYLRFENNGT